ncbi:MAG: TIR domain-containing protein [Candidatus Erginobacter occultus]|nr:TIR domain-containing protein [Candidatus Erginobacter occultus]
MEHDVFICHSAKDKAVAQQICDELEQKDVRCWIAPRDITVGTVYGGAIVEAIAASRIMVFVFSSNSNQSPHVLRELERAVSKNLRIVPFRIEDVQPGPSIEYFITSSQWFDAFSGLLENHVNKLVQALQRCLAPEGSCTEFTVPIPPATREPTLAAPRATSSNEFERGLAHIEESLRNQKWCRTVMTCGQLLEKAMKKLLDDARAEDADNLLSQRLRDAERHIGRGRRFSDNFALDEMVHLYLETDLFSELRRRLSSSLQKVKQLDWDKLVSCFDDAKNPRHSQDVGREDANEMVYGTKLFLYDCELLGAKQKVDPVPEDERQLTACPICGTAVTEGWSYCPACGAQLKLVCPVCHRALAAAFRICPYCETRISRHPVGETEEHRRACEEYRVFCAGAYLDGVVNVREREMLGKKRLALGLTQDEAYEIERQCAPHNVLEYTRLVEGVLVDGTIDENERVFLKTKAGELGIDEWLARQVELVVQKIAGLIAPDMVS